MKQRNKKQPKKQLQCAKFNSKDSKKMGLWNVGNNSITKISTITTYFVDKEFSICGRFKKIIIII